VTSLSVVEPAPIAAPVTTGSPGGAPAARWWSDVAEFLLVGGLTPFLFPLSWALQRGFGLDPAELAVSFTMFYAAHAINDPHFAVTYLLFYKDARARALGDAWNPMQRARYVLAGFVVPVVLAAWATVGLATKSASTVGAMIELMFMLVGWHYVKQGFGVMMVLSARRGVTFLPRERMAILAHCFAGWAYAWASPAAAPREVEERGLVYMAIAHPAWLDKVTGLVFVATTVAMVVLLALKWRRDRRLPIATPLVALLASVWAWSIYSGIDPLIRYMIPALHSVQYIYMVGLLKGNEARDREARDHDKKPFSDMSAKVRLGLLAASALGLGWVLFHGFPDVLDGALVARKDRGTSLGATPYLAAVNAVVNIHHYFMDYVIWRRENPLTRYLRVRPAPVSAAAMSGEPA
jgi:hypothetical protein